MKLLSRLALAASLTLPIAAHAKELATGAEITAAVAGNPNDF